MANSGASRKALGERAAPVRAAGQVVVLSFDRELPGPGHPDLAVRRGSSGWSGRWSGHEAFSAGVNSFSPCCPPVLAVVATLLRHVSPTGTAAADPAPARPPRGPKVDRAGQNPAWAAGAEPSPRPGDGVLRIHGSGRSLHRPFDAGDGQRDPLGSLVGIGPVGVEPGHD